MIFVDTNVVLDIVSEDAHWFDWSETRLVAAAREGDVSINVIVIAEMSRSFSTIDQLHRVLAVLAINVLDLDDVSAFAAGKRFAVYRRTRADDKTARVLPDFLIGAHALTLGSSLLTRDTAIYRRYFPDLSLITPETHP